ncbi:response regulator transcription factor [Zoogloea sp.]|uniref:response regulator n=1 Tax=Zoogloea sp. TaxID=49181 RepID=UPI0014157F38|nr:MAG: response regulator transcription factor [Zoogloea sp.]
MTLRIALADDHRMFREALRGMLARETDLRIAGETASTRETLDLLGRVRTDVLLLDISFPDGNGIELAQQVRRLYPDLAIVALTGHSERIFIEEMLKAGAQAYVVKSAGLDELLRALRAAAQGQTYLCASVLDTMLGHTLAVRSADTPPPPSVLTPREQEVLALLAGGRRSLDIARSLDISTATVEVHRRNLKGKLGLRTTAELTRYAIRSGLVTA